METGEVAAAARSNGVGADAFRGGGGNGNEAADMAYSSMQAAESRSAFKTPADDARFDPSSGAPMNAPAKRMCIDMWESAAGADSAGVPVVRQIFFKDVEEATDLWSEARNLGMGASCQVFSGVLFGRLGVAVKKLKADVSEWEMRQFASEMALLCSVSHRNIVR